MELFIHNKISEEQTLWWNLYSVTSTPNMAYQQNYSPVYPTHTLPTPLSDTTVHVTRDRFCIERNLSITFQRRD